MNNDPPALWRALFPVPSSDIHKYRRGHAVILGGNRMTGAARLAAMAAMRSGAGLCTIVAGKETGAIYRAGPPHILYESLNADGFAGHLADSRRNAVLLGPGFGREEDEFLQKSVLETLSGDRAAVLDADALTVFEDREGPLFDALHENCILTPHHGEFARLFPGGAGGDPVAAACMAARRAGAVIVLKGASTVIAHPDGRYALNRHATPYLATAGAGDVLAGIILGLVAQGMPAFDAACAAAWIHGEAGLRFGPGLVAPDLIEQIPGILRELT